MLLAKIVVCKLSIVKLQKNHPKSSWNTWRSLKYECNLTTSKLQQILVKLCSLTTCSLKWNSRQKATKALFVIEYESNLRVKA